MIGWVSSRDEDGVYEASLYQDRCVVAKVWYVSLLHWSYAVYRCQPGSTPITRGRAYTLKGAVKAAEASLRSERGDSGE